MSAILSRPSIWPQQTAMWQHKASLYAEQNNPCPDYNVHGANMGPTWVLLAPDGPQVGPMNLAIRVSSFPPQHPWQTHHSLFLSTRYWASCEIYLLYLYLSFCMIHTVMPHYRSISIYRPLDGLFKNLLRLTINYQSSALLAFYVENLVSGFPAHRASTSQKVFPCHSAIMRSLHPPECFLFPGVMTHERCKGVN